uniref:Uncharacterized protein n=1 Tax=Kalanchoe fedtschenkoi TaxID=63787 RepID=A0A7N1A4B7_KALFE
MASVKHSSRYNSYDLRSSNSSQVSDPSSSAEFRPKQSSIRTAGSGSGYGSSSRRNDSAIVKAKAEVRVDQNNLSSMVKKFMEKRSAAKSSVKPAGLFVPADFIADDLKKTAKKGSNFGGLHKKLFGKGSSGSACKNEVKALTEVKSNTRTLAMVLKSERELLSRNKELEEEVRALSLKVEEKGSEVEKLKDLCLKQREEIKSLKNAILFPDVMNSQLQDLLEKQGLELKQAKQVIPSLQKQVSSLTGQLQCLAEDLAEVKADKYASSASFERHESPQTPPHNQERSNSLEFSSGDPTSPVSSDLMLLNDINPCLTPFYVKTESNEFEVEGYESAEEDIISENNHVKPDDTVFDVNARRMSRSSDYYFTSSNQVNLKVSATDRSNESKYKYSKPMHHKLFK